MLRKIVLVGVMCIPLMGALTTQTSVPVLLAMGCLILFALSVALRSEQNG